MLPGTQGPAGHFFEKLRLISAPAGAIFLTDYLKMCKMFYADYCKLCCFVANHAMQLRIDVDLHTRSTYIWGFVNRAHFHSVVYVGYFWQCSTSESRMPDFVKYFHLLSSMNLAVWPK